MQVNVSFAAVVVAVGLASSTGVLACGEDENGTARTATSAELTRGIVSAQDIGRYVDGTPERALLEWFQAVQFSDVAAAQRLVSQAALDRVGGRSFRSAVTTVGSALGWPRIVMTRRAPGGREAAIRVFVQSYRRGQRSPASSSPATFLLRNSGGWKLSDLGYLIRSSEEIEQARRQTSSAANRMTAE